MQRAILVTAVFLMGALLGQNSAKRLSLRRDMLGDLIASIRRLSMRMEYARLPLHRMAEQCAGGTAAPVFAAFAAALEEGRTPLAAWETAEERALLHEQAFAALHPGDREVLRTFAGALGTADLRREQQNAAMALQELERLQAEAGAAYDRKGRVYRAMGVLCGAAVAILLL